MDTTGAGCFRETVVGSKLRRAVVAGEVTAGDARTWGPSALQVLAAGWNGTVCSRASAAELGANGGGLTFLFLILLR